MFQSLLVPLDGSKFAEEAIPLALSIANRTGASLELLRAREFYGSGDPHVGWAPYDPAADAKLKEQAQGYLDAIVKRLQMTASVPVTSALVNGFAEDAIMGRVQSKPADLIVMTTHGLGPLSRFWLGSVADELVRHGPVPIVLVRPQEARHDQSATPILKRILIPLDGSELAERVLEPVIALGCLMDTEYTLIRVVEPCRWSERGPLVAELIGMEHPEVEQRKGEAQTYLDNVAERLRTKGMRIETRVVVGESAAAAVLDAANDQNIDLIAVATHGHGGLKRLLLGSVADKIVRGALTPVLVYRPTAT